MENDLQAGASYTFEVNQIEKKKKKFGTHTRNIIEEKMKTRASISYFNACSVGGKNLSSQLQNATSKFSGKFQINVTKLIKLDDGMCHPNRHHIGISKFAMCHLAHRIKINSLFKIYG